MTRASITIAINAPAEAVWRLICDFGAACQYLDKVEDCTVKGEGVGALRRLTHVDGSTIVERLETLDEAAHRLSYALLTGTPFRNCLTRVALRDCSEGLQCELAWSATFEADGLPASEAEELMEGSLAANGLALKGWVERGKRIIE